MPDLAVAHACILSLALLTPFTLSPSVDVFYAFRMIQTALMGQYVLLHPKGNSKLQALLNGTPFQRIFFCTSWDDLKVSLNCFKHSHAVFFCDFLTLPISNRCSIWDPRRHLFWTANIPGTGSFYKCSRTNSSWPK